MLSLLPPPTCRHYFCGHLKLLLIKSDPKMFMSGVPILFIKRLYQGSKHGERVLDFRTTGIYPGIFFNSGIFSQENFIGAVHH